MSENIMQPSDTSVETFLNAIPNEQKRQDSLTLLSLFKDVTAAEPHLWGSSIVGFVAYHYHYESGREGDAFEVGFSPRKQNLTLYLGCNGFAQEVDLLEKLGKYKAGKGCLYINKIQDIDLPTLKELIRRSLQKHC